MRRQWRRLALYWILAVGVSYVTVLSSQACKKSGLEMDETRIGRTCGLSRWLDSWPKR